ncbi:MAG: hypothetical protein NZ901_06540 [Geminocystis sp.]|nr:hypothetical protein [Geminocystis sp.]MCS7147837.1 hypothetical protein [Geminocystis sp.]MDW8116796.1 hypothetical protein [Geminocystis sp.]MDW8464005.1 hypothetical protein [Geminocystis sp.]
MEVTNRNTSYSKEKQGLGKEDNREEFRELERVYNEPYLIWEYNILGLKDAMDVLLTSLVQITDKNEAKLCRQRIEYEYIHKGLYSYFIQKTRKYKEWGFENYEQFCREILKHSYETERKFQKAAEVALILARAKFELLPGTKQQALILYKAKLSPEQLVQFWGELLEHTNGQSPTTNQIREKLNYMGLNGDFNNNKIDRSILRQFYMEAERLGFSDVNEYLERLLHVSQVCGRELLVEPHEAEREGKNENIASGKGKTVDNTSVTEDYQRGAKAENPENEKTPDCLSKTGIKNQILFKIRDSLAAHMFFKNCCSITRIDSDTVRINLWTENIDKEQNEELRKSKINFLLSAYERYKAKIEEAINKLLGREVEVVAHIGQIL